MLGEESNRVRNVKAVGSNVTLRHGRREEVRLQEVAPECGLRSREQAAVGQDQL
jgi:hypothetical protein